MNEKLTIGQYLQGDSIVHKMDARIKLIITTLFIISIFFVDGFIGFAFYAAFVLFVIFIAEVPLKQILRGLRPIVAVIILTLILNIVTTPGETLFRFWIFNVTKEGLYRAVFVSIRIILLVFGTSLLTLSTSPLSLTDGIESLLKPLIRFHFPAHELAMMISIALSFIPTLFNEADKIRKAQTARGADFESGNIIARAKAMIPLMVPLFLNSFHRAEELGTAMEARCYRGGEGRTRLNPPVLKKSDVIIFIGVSIYFALIAVFF